MLFNEREILVRKLYNKELMSEAERRRAQKGTDIRLQMGTHAMPRMMHWFRSLWTAGGQHWHGVPQQPVR